MTQNKLVRSTTKPWAIPIPAPLERKTEVAIFHIYTHEPSTHWTMIARQLPLSKTKQML